MSTEEDVDKSPSTEEDMEEEVDVDVDKVMEKVKKSPPTEEDTEEEVMKSTSIESLMPPQFFHEMLEIQVSMNKTVQALTWFYDNQR